MRTLTLIAIAFCLTIPAAAESEAQVTPAENVWVGKLVDWGCKKADPEPPCPVGPATKEFAISIDGGRILHFDEQGNERAVEAIKQSGAGGNVPAKVTGRRDGKMLAVERVEIE